jgi:hypothetical protein
MQIEENEVSVSTSREFSHVAVEFSFVNGDETRRISLPNRVEDLE